MTTPIRIRFCCIANLQSWNICRLYTPHQNAVKLQLSSHFETRKAVVQVGTSAELKFLFMFTVTKLELTCWLYRNEAACQ